MTNQDNILSIRAKSTSLASLAAKMNNFYRIRYADNYIPLEYMKKIDQKDYQEDRVTIYDQENGLAFLISNLDRRINTSYHLQPETRDFFSALYYLRFQASSDSGKIWIDANNVIWKCSFSRIGTEYIRSPLGKISCDRIKIDFRRIDNKESERTDMLTNNLVDEEISLHFWFTSDERRLPLKAKFYMKPFPVTWVLESHED